MTDIQIFYIRHGYQFHVLDALRIIHPLVIRRVSEITILLDINILLDYSSYFRDHSESGVSKSIYHHIESWQVLRE